MQGHGVPWLGMRLCTPPRHSPLLPAYGSEEERLGRGAFLALIWENSGMGPTGHLAGADKCRLSASAPLCEGGYGGGEGKAQRRLERNLTRINRVSGTEVLFTDLI